MFKIHRNLRVVLSLKAMKHICTWTSLICSLLARHGPTGGLSQHGTGFWWPAARRDTQRSSVPGHRTAAWCELRPSLSMTSIHCSSGPISMRTMLGSASQRLGSRQSVLSGLTAGCKAIRMNWTMFLSSKRVQKEGVVKYLTRYMWQLT